MAGREMAVLSLIGFCIWTWSIHSEEIVRTFPADWVTTNEASSCWQAPYTFDVCCPSWLNSANCWSGGFTFDSCCLPEIRMQIKQHFALLDTARFLEASNNFARIVNFYGLDSASAEVSLAHQGFEKAASVIRREFDDAPNSLSYAEVLFAGAGIPCEPLSLNGTSPTLYSEWGRCCKSAGIMESCYSVFEMMAVALGQRHARTPEEQDQYYGNMSELWAFHHFTPSVLAITETPFERMSDIHRVTKLNSHIANALLQSGEPTLGIMWAESTFHPYHPSHTSLKFQAGVVVLANVFNAIQVENNEIGHVDVFEIGAGFGTIPRLLASARQRLAQLPTPIFINRFVAFDLRSAHDLQRWYLRKTVGELVNVHAWADYPSPADLEVNGSGIPEGVGNLVGGRTALPVELVSPLRRDLFAYHMAEEAALQAADKRPTRVLLAVNSWHEFSIDEFSWYYNNLFAAPQTLSGVDWIVYVSNKEFQGTQTKDRMILGNPAWKVYEEDCGPVTCFRLLQRTLRSM